MSEVASSVTAASPLTVSLNSSLNSSLTQRTTFDVREALAGRRGRWRLWLSLAGPAVIASIAYMDPGNFATNIQAGSKYGYSLLWVVVLANLIGMLFQALSGKLGLVTGRNLAQLCRAEFSRPVVLFMWGVSEVAAIATDLAELVGGGIGFSLLLNTSLMTGMVITAGAIFAFLLIERRGFRPVEIAIAVLISIIGLAYLAELFIAPVAWPSVFGAMMHPHVPDRDGLTLSLGILGATVMPHVLFLHSGLVQNRVKPRNRTELSTMLRFSHWEVVIALGVAGLINLAMVIMAAGAFHQGVGEVVEIGTAYRTLGPLLGAAAATLFLTALIAAGVSSSVVGTMAGQMIMQGFVGFSIPVWLRRLVTVVPSFVIVASGVNPTQALVMSQVVLSIALPVPMLALIWLTSRPRLMGEWCNRPAFSLFAGAAAVVVLSLNMVMLVQML
jgi:manganese transport protein